MSTAATRSTAVDALTSRFAMASEGVELAREFGSDGNWGNFLRAEIAARLIEKAEWDRAERLLEDAIDAAPAGTAAAIGYVHLAELLALRGDFDRSREAVLAGANQVPESRASQWQAPVAIASATLEMWAGDPEQLLGSCRKHSRAREKPSFCRTPRSCMSSEREHARTSRRRPCATRQRRSARMPSRGRCSSASTGRRRG